MVNGISPILVWVSQSRNYFLQLQILCSTTAYIEVSNNTLDIIIRIFFFYTLSESELNESELGTLYQ